MSKIKLNVAQQTFEFGSCTNVKLKLPKVLRQKVSTIAVGGTFYHNGAVHQRLKPVNFLCNSSLITDILVRGDVLVVNLAKGTAFIMHGAKIVTAVATEIHYHAKTA